MELTINVTCGNLRNKIFLAQRAQKIVMPHCYHLSSLLLIALESMQLLVLIQHSSKQNTARFATEKISL